ncbi:hypothetical protein C1Y40_00393 [Mycobacterium talmoniae]|uniref:Uncharacterized protein n=1 Tax=Mycobacterium talmoniae TaxID=1858794 RepID=A0A2S8BRV1_9MYCO|nr:DUF6585 family protein [Mycobacterium eburneum]PQM49371.1 hypothetical protein C1Y40_00393 [Mycobacterium talmoniae]TDH51390.1 hypothetical protein E2F47_16065 [Mycobacterium eburneum]
MTRRESDPELLRQIGAAAQQAGLGEHRTRYWWAPPLNNPRGMTLLVVGSLWVSPLLSRPVQPVAVIGCSLVLAIVAGPIVGELLYGAIQRSRRLDLFEHGLTVARRGELRVVRYADTSVGQRLVEHRSRGSLLWTSYRYTLTDTAGRQCTVTGRFERPAEWGQAIQQAVAQTQLPAAVAAISAGQRIDFGKFWISEQQLCLGGAVRSWSEILDLYIAKTSMRLVLKDRFVPRTVTFRWTTNYGLFVALAERYARGRTIVATDC